MIDHLMRGRKATKPANRREPSRISSDVVLAGLFCLPVLWWRVGMERFGGFCSCGVFSSCDSDPETWERAVGDLPPCTPSSASLLT